jgi:hypothetical protein
MRYFKDGDHLCVVSDKFVDLQESPAFFVKENTKEAKDIKEVIDEDNKKIGR